VFLSGAANAHTRLNDLAINDALRIVNGCLRPTPADNLPILAGIQPAELRRKGAALSLARHATEPEHLLHSAVTCPPSANTQRLKSRRSICTRRTTNNIRAAHWADRQ